MPIQTYDHLCLCLEVQVPEDTGEGLYYCVCTDYFYPGRSILLIPPQSSPLNLLTDLSGTKTTVIECLKTGLLI